MNQKLISEIGKSQRLQIINQLKRTQGLAVSELANRLKMSYMGVKQHCIELERKGYLNTMRRPKSIGRPEMIYRLTERARELFPIASNGETLALLDAAKKLYGSAAPEKLLLLVFQKKEEQYRSKMRGATPAERMKSLAKLRDAEGCMADFESDKNGARIVEHHSPIADLARAYPLITRLETEMFQRLLGIALTRSENHVAGLYSCAFLAPSLAPQSAMENDTILEEPLVEPISESSDESFANDERAEIAPTNPEKMTVSDEDFSKKIEPDLESHETVIALENEESAKIELSADPLSEPILEQPANHEVAKTFVGKEPPLVISETENPPDAKIEIDSLESTNRELTDPELARAEMIESPAEPLAEPISEEVASPQVLENEHAEESVSLTAKSEIAVEKIATTHEISTSPTAEHSETETPEPELPRIGIRKLPQVKPKPLVRRNKSAENQPDLFSL